MAIKIFFGSIYRYSQRKKFDDFIESSSNLKSTQERLLYAILRRNANSEFGKNHDFENIRSILQFRNRVPIQYDQQLNPYIERQLTGEKNILAVEDIIGFLRSSGGSGKSKVIAYTNELVKEFVAGTSAMLYSLFDAPQTSDDISAYWLVGPEFVEPEVSAGGYSIGHQESLDIFYQFDRHFFKNHIICDAKFKKLSRAEYLREASQKLVRFNQLQMLFVNSPLALIELCDYLDASNDELPRLSNGAVDFSALWPNLKSICCWKDGGANFYIPLIHQRFPKVKLIPREIISAEALLAVPMADHPHCLLAVNSHFYEFQDADGKVVGAENLLRGFSYIPIVTTSGGLYRYYTGDLVEVMGHVNGVPMLRYVSRHLGDGAFGEKLDEERLSLIIEHLYLEFSITPRFHLIEAASKKNPHYTLFLECQQQLDILMISKRLEEMLLDSHQYNLCRTIGELQEILIIPVTDGWNKYVSAMMKNGCKSYEMISPALISAFSGWEELFR